VLVWPRSASRSWPRSSRAERCKTCVGRYCKICTLRTRLRDNIVAVYQLHTVVRVWTPACPLLLTCLLLLLSCLHQASRAGRRTDAQPIQQKVDPNPKCIWLGHSEAISSLLDQNKKPRSGLEKACYYLPMDDTPKHLSLADVEFVKHPYRTRAWTIREVLLARSITILCGISRIISADFSLGTTDRLERIGRQLRGSMEDPFEKILIWRSLLFIRLVKGPVRKSPISKPR
jgi:hypothetical protein